jgi:hypothetical protein
MRHPGIRGEMTPEDFLIGRRSSKFGEIGSGA